jgi:hypothetical protein
MGYIDLQKQADNAVKNYLKTAFNNRLVCTNVVMQRFRKFGYSHRFISTMKQNYAPKYLQSIVKLSEKLKDKFFSCRLYVFE